MSDLIDRQAAIKCLIDALYDLDEADYVDNTFIKEELKKVPSVQREQKTGIWIDCPFNNLMDKRMMCDQCGSVETNLNHASFCPNCGAKMEGDTSV